MTTKLAYLTSGYGVIEAAVVILTLAGSMALAGYTALCAIDDSAPVHTAQSR